jgi:Zn-dependent metalloprotease
MKRAMTVGAIVAVTAAGLSATPAVGAGHPSPHAQRSAVTSVARADPHFSPADRAAVLGQARTDATATAHALGLGAGQQLTAFDASQDVSGATHVRYQRTYRGLRVIGGDLVVHRNSSGAVVGADYASRPQLRVASTHATAARPAPRSKVVVFAVRHKPVLAWETRTRSSSADGDPIDRLEYVDARTGKHIAGWNQIATVDNDKGLYTGTVSVASVLSGSTYQLTDTGRGGSSTYDANNSTSTSRGTLFTDADDAWGNGSTSSRQSAAVDAAYGAANTWDFYKNTFGRNGIKNNGVGAYSRVHYGSSYENAFWDDSCFCMTYGDGASSFKALVSIDVAGHEMSHGVTSNTAGLNYTGESGGLNESTSDIFGTMVEFYAAAHSPVQPPADPGDYYIGETIAKDGTYLRRMDHPSLDGGSADCWYSGVGNLDVHYSSGVGNHFFYLLAEGSGAKTIGGRAHNGTTCNSASVAGIGQANAGAIWYRALTTYMVSTTNYKGARDATVKAARDLYGATSTQCAAVEAAWNAVSVPANAESCGTTGGGGSDGTNLLQNPGFESGATTWTQTAGVISTGSNSQPRTGAYVAWLDGYGTAHTDSVQQSVAIPAGKTSATLSFWLKVTSSETTTTSAYDTLKVQAISGGTTTTLATYSNLNKGTSYAQRTLNLSGYIGKTVTVKFLGVEDTSLATSFRVDDTALTTA